MNTPPPPLATDRLARRRARVEAIRAGALVRQALGQSALYEHTGDVHIVTYRGERFVGETIGEAIGEAREARTIR